MEVKIHMNTNLNEKTIFGRLIYDDNGDYILSTPGTVNNLSKLLSLVYYADNNRINIKISSSTPDGLKVLYNEDGNLLKRKSDFVPLYTYHICGSDLETTLFYAVDNFLEIILTAEALEERNQHGTTKLCAV